MHKAIINEGKMNDQECIIKNFSQSIDFLSFSVDKVFAVKALQM